MKRVMRAALSVLLAVILVIGAVPATAFQVFAASNLSNGFEGMDSDVFSALGFDTSEIPEGYDAETTDNPYGRDLIPMNQVFELSAATEYGSALYGKGYDYVNTVNINNIPSSGTGTGLKMSASAAGDFDGDGLAGEIVYVGYSSAIQYYSSTENNGGATTDLSIRLYDGKTDTYSETKKVGAVTPYNTIPSDSSGFVNVAQWQTTMDMYWQNLLQVTAGDYDGDNISEIAVYVAENQNARIDIYKYMKTSLSSEGEWMDVSKWERVWSYAMSGDFNYVPNMVSLVSGDFNRDGIDDLALSYGSAVMNEQIFTGMMQYMNAGKAYVLWGSRSAMLQSRFELDLNSKELGEQVRVSLIKGDLDGDGVEELIATGQLKEDLAGFYTLFATSLGAGNSTRTITTYLYDESLGLVINNSDVYYPVEGSMETVTVDNSTTTKWVTKNGFDQYYYSLPLMRTNAAVFYPEGSDYRYLYLDSCLYKCMEGSISLIGEMDEKYDGTNTLGALNDTTYWGHRSVENFSSSNGSYTNDQSYYVEYGATSADVNGFGYDLLAVNFMGAQIYQYSGDASHSTDYAVVSGSSDGQFIASIVNTPIKVTYKVDQQVYEISDATHDYNAVDFCFIDCDVDSIIMEYTGQHYLTYSDPKVLAIIAAPPFFKDVDEVSGGDFASDNCSTSWGLTEGHGDSKSVSVDFSVGAWAENSITTATGQLDINGGLCYTLSWEKSTSHSYEYTMTFTTAGGEDAVAFFCIPTENYVYTVKTPDGKGGYETVPYIISNTFSPCYQVLTLDYYETIQGNYSNLPAIAGVAINSTPGDPASYPSSTSGYDVITEWNRDAAGVSFGNGSIEQEIAISTETEESYSMGAEFSFEIGGGLSAQVDMTQSGYESKGGLQFSINPAGGWADTTMDGTTITGEVANMPEEFREYGYYFSWKLFSYNYVFDDKTSVPVISYLVNDVSAPPVLPEDFQQDYDRTTSDKNVLTWTYSGECSNFILYKYEEFPVGTGLREVARIAPGDSTHYRIKYDENGTPYKEFFFEDTNLSSYTEYQYSIQVERLGKVPPLSSPSALVTARTRADDGYPSIIVNESDKQNDGKLLVYPDKNADLSLDVKGPAGETISNYYTTVLYQWQKQVNGAWEDIIGETGDKLSFISAGVADAGSYRCRVNVITKAGNMSITAYSDPVVLTHAKRTSVMENVSVFDVTGGIELYAELKNAHADSASIPGGMVSFTLTSGATGKTWQKNVIVNAAGIADTVLEDELPEGLYTVSAVYSGSYIFKSSTGEALYLSQRSTGFEIDTPTAAVYGEGAEVTFLSVTKRNGITVASPVNADTYGMYKASALSLKSVSGSTTYTSGAVTKGTKYSYVDNDGAVWYFTAAESATPVIKTTEGIVLFGDVLENTISKDIDTGAYKIADNTAAGTYAIRMTVQSGLDTVDTYALIDISSRKITLRIPDYTVSESATESMHSILVSDATLESGSWADCDFENGVLKDSLINANLTAVFFNTAETFFDSFSVRRLCGAYRIESKRALANYDVTYIPGTLTVLGATHGVTVSTRYFENQSVGTVYAISPVYDSSRARVSDADRLVINQQTGTRMVFSAVPDKGYEVYNWFVNGKSIGSTSSTLVYTLLNEETTVEVQFAVTKNTLIFGTAGDENGGSIICSKADLTSGSVVLANSPFTFYAQPNEGFHFKEWRYTELNNGTVYDPSDEPYDFFMPQTSCSLYAVFERDFYTLTFEDASGNGGLVASYVNREGETVLVTSGDSVKGDSVITIKPAAGFSFDNEYRYVATGTEDGVTDASGAFTFALKGDTSVRGWTKQNYYDLTLKLNYIHSSDEPFTAGIVAYIDGEERTADFTEDGQFLKLENVKGGSSVTLEATYPGWVIFDGWTSSFTKVTASATPNKLATGIAQGGAVEKGAAYFYTYFDGVSNKTLYFTAPCTGTFRYDAEQVTVYSSALRYTLPEFAADETVALNITEKPVYMITLNDIGTKGTYIISEAERPEGVSLQVNGTMDGFTSGKARIHQDDAFILAVMPTQGYTVSYWRITPESTGTMIQNKASSLKYTIPAVNDNFTFEPVFSSSTYNTISWPTISESQNALTLVPEAEYLSSVSQGSDFKFTFSGAGEKLVKRVFANGNEFLAAGNTVEGTTYSVTGGVYTIHNILENQVVTVEYKDIGVTVNGVDICQLNGTGWKYSPATETLTLTKNRLTISGTNSQTLAPNFSITAEEAASSVILDNLTMQSQAEDALLAFRSDSTNVSLVNKNKVHGSATNIAIADGDLSVNGIGELHVIAKGDESAGLFVKTKLTISGSPYISISSEKAGGIVSEGDIQIGLENNTNVRPNVYVSAPQATAIQTITMTQHNGSLHVTGKDTAVDFNGKFLVYDGDVEMSAEGAALSPHGMNGLFQAWYLNGYMCRSMDVGGAEVTDTYSKLSTNYNYPANSNRRGFDMLAASDDSIEGHYNEFSLDKAKYFHLSPVSATSTDFMVYVKVNGKEYYTPVGEFSSYSRKMFYVDVSDTSSNKLKWVDITGSPVVISNPGLADGDIIVFETTTEDNPRFFFSSFIIREDNESYQDHGIFYIVPNEEKYDYAISGSVSGTVGSSSRGGIYGTTTTAAGTTYFETVGYMGKFADATYHPYKDEDLRQSIKSLTLRSFTGTSLSVGDYPVYLEGDNYLIASWLTNAISVPDSRLDLRSDGNGTLTITQHKDQTAAPLTVDEINMVNVKRLSVYGSEGNDALATATSGITDVEVTYKDNWNNPTAVTELEYGHGWLEDAGTASGSSSTQATLQAKSGYSYISFYAATTDAKAIPSKLTYDKTASPAQDAAFTLTSPAESGRLHNFNPSDTAHDCKIVLVGTTEEVVDTQNYSFAGNTLTLKKEWLTGLATGEYALRVYFYDEDPSDATHYTLEIPLTITAQAISEGSLAPVPESTGFAPICLTRGRTVSLGTTFTGTTPKAYKWTLVEPTTNLTLTADKGSAVLTVEEDAAIGTYQITVQSFADEAMTDELGTANFYIRVARKATGITISCAGETPSGDGSYTLNHINLAGTAKTWRFVGAVQYDTGTINSDVTFKLWGATRALTDVDPTGILTIDPKETGTDGKLILTATHVNEDGTKLSKSIDIRLSTDAIVGYTAPAAGGTIASAGIDAAGTVVTAEKSVTFTATAADEFALDKWYVNGNEVENGNTYRIDAETGALTFRAEKMGRYTVTASFRNTSLYAVKFEAGEHGTVTATSAGKAIKSGTRVDKNDSAVITAVPDAFCEVAAWYVNGVLLTGFTGTEYTLPTLSADVTVRVEFAVPERVVTVTAGANGTVSFLKNGEPVQASVSSNVYTIGVSNLDTVTVMAVPERGYAIAGWTVPIDATVSEAICTLKPGTGDAAVEVTFEPLEAFTLTVNTNSYENGSGTVTVGTTVIPMATSQNITIYKGETVVLTAAPDAGSILESWTVTGADYTEKGNTVTVLKAESDVTVSALFRRTESTVTFNASPANGTVGVTYSLSVVNLPLATDKAVVSGDLIPNGSVLTILMTPADSATEVSAMAINGSEVTPVHNVSAGTYTYVIDPLTEDTEIEVTFTAVTLYEVVSPKEFTEEIPETGTVITGTIAPACENNGFNSISIAASSTLQIVEGGSFELTFTPSAGYKINATALLNNIQAILDAAASDADVTLRKTGAGYAVTVTGLDKALDLTGLASPFVAENPAVVYHTLTITEPANGKLTAFVKGVEVLSGAAIEEGTVVTVRTEADAHMRLASVLVNTDELTKSTFTMTEDVTLSASFETGEYKLTLTVLGSGSGTITVNGITYAAGEYWIPVGTELTFDGVAGQNSALSVLTVAGSTTDRTVQMNSDVAVSAEFVDSARVVTFNTPKNGTVKLLDIQGQPIPSGTSVAIGSKVFVVVTPNAHYAKKTLTIGGLPLTEDYFTVDAVRGNNIYCDFAATEVTVSWTATYSSVTARLMPNGDAIQNGQYVPTGSMISFSHTAQSSNYSLDKFTVTGASLNSATGWYIADQGPIKAESVYKYSGDVPPSSGGGTTVVIHEEQTPLSAGTFGVIIEIINGEKGSVSVTADDKEIESGEDVSVGTELAIKATPKNKNVKASVKVNGVELTGTSYSVYANTLIQIEFTDKTTGIPFFVGENGKHVYVSFSYDTDGDGYYTEAEYIVPSRTEVDFEENNPVFEDVAATYWAADYINFVAEREIFVGDAGIFNPKGNMTREMFVTVIGRLYERSYGKLKATNPTQFSDCDYSAYYADYVDWASSNGIVEGRDDGTFGKGQSITRQEMVTMMYRFVKFLGVEKTNVVMKELNFIDRGRINDWAVEAVQYFNSCGIVEGRDDGSFAPRDFMTRAEAATVITKFIQSMFK